MLLELLSLRTQVLLLSGHINGLLNSYSENFALRLHIIVISGGCIRRNCDEEHFRRLYHTSQAQQTTRESHLRRHSKGLNQFAGNKSYCWCRRCRRLCGTHTSATKNPSASLCKRYLKYLFMSFLVVCAYSLIFSYDFEYDFMKFCMSSRWTCLILIPRMPPFLLLPLFFILI